ncbi:MAG: DJ-1 family glyoxalase III [Eubacteriales bacterium]
MKVYIHLADGFEEIEAITILDVLRRANILTETISVTKEKHVTGAHHMTIIADKLFEDADYDSCDMIVLPGGMPGTLNLQNHNGLIDKIKDFHFQSKWLAAICAAPKILGNLGLLKGITATCYPGFEEELYDARLTKDPVVQEGHIITSRGAGTALMFSLKLVEILIDKVTALDLKEKMIAF